MDEALELSEYLPISFAADSERQYIAFLWEAFESNYTAKKYEFASLAFHLLYMSFVSFSIWQIRMVREREFGHALVGFLSDSEKDLLAADSPFKFYEKLKESQIFRFLKLIGCDNAQVGEFAKFVRRRNKIAHPTGTVFFNDQEAIDAEIGEMLREVRNIERHMAPVIRDVYARFLIDSANVEEREYVAPKEEVNANLIHRAYISLEDVKICRAFDITTLKDQKHYAGIEALHATLIETYPEQH